jgi:hypothetical protein
MSGYSNDHGNPDASIPCYLGSNPGGSQPSPTSQGDEMPAIPIYIVPAPFFGWKPPYGNRQGGFEPSAIPVRFVERPIYPGRNRPNDQGNDDSAIPVFIVGPPEGEGPYPNKKWNPGSAIPVWDVSAPISDAAPSPPNPFEDDVFVWGAGGKE